MPLFVVLREGPVLDDALRDTLRARIREALSSRHVPNEIVQAHGVPRTLSGKKMKVPIKKLLLGHAPQSIANRDAMANPERWTGTSTTPRASSRRGRPSRLWRKYVGDGWLIMWPSLSTTTAMRNLLNLPTENFQGQPLVRIGHADSYLLLAPQHGGRWSAGYTADRTSCIGPRPPTGAARPRSAAATRCCSRLSAGILSRATQGSGVTRKGRCIRWRSMASRATCRLQSAPSTRARQSR